MNLTTKSFNASYDGSYNFTVRVDAISSQISAKTNTSIITGSDETDDILVDLSSTCSVNPPTVTFNISTTETPIGRPSNLTANIEFINNNVGSSCLPLLITAKLLLPRGFTLLSYTNTTESTNNNNNSNSNSSSKTVNVDNDVDSHVITLETNGYASFATQIHIRENMSPKAYTLAIEASATGFELGKPSRSEKTFTVQCPTPEAPNNVSFKQVASVFSKNRVMLTWKACENELFCCCPCSWMVFRDGVYIGSSSARSFTDSFNLDGGVDYNYSVITVDSAGMHSPPDTCRNAVLVTGESADITTYVIIFACAAVFILTVTTTIVVIAVYLNWEKIDSKLKIWKINALQKLFVLRGNH